MLSILHIIIIGYIFIIIISIYLYTLYNTLYINIVIILITVIAIKLNIIVTIDHKTSYEGQSFKIEMYTPES